jgi:hypothetical protein
MLTVVVTLEDPGGIGGLLMPEVDEYKIAYPKLYVSMAAGLLLMLSQTAYAEPVESGIISTIGTALAPLPMVVVAAITGYPAVVPPDVALLVSGIAEAGYGPVATRIAADPATGAAAMVVLVMLFNDTNIRTPDGMLWKLAWRRVPKSAKPAVPFGVLIVNPDSVL